MNAKRTIALAVAGGGYRATLFSLGSLWRLNQFGLLQKLSKITSVFGGSILTGYIAMRWHDLIFDASGRAENFHDVIAEPIQKFCANGIDVKSVISGLFSFKDTIGDKIAKAYDKGLFKGAMIQTIPNDAPEFLFYGTNYQTGSSIGIQKKAIYDYKIGRYLNPDISIAKTVGVSSAFPPVLSPVTFRTDPGEWEKIKGEGLSEYFDDVRLRKTLILADGGLYDNLGLEAVWKRVGIYMASSFRAKKNGQWKMSRYFK
jgi:NTE family protein